MSLTTLTYIAADLIALAVLVGALYAPRHSRKDLMAAYIGVNVGVLAVTLLLSTASVAAGLGLATSRAPRTCAAVLAALNVPFTLINNPVWAVSGEEARKQALSGLARGGAVGAGLLLAAVDREGRPSLVWRIESHKRRRKVVAAARAAVHDHHM